MRLHNAWVNKQRGVLHIGQWASASRSKLLASHVLGTTAASIVEHEEAPLVRVDDLRRDRLVSGNGRQSRSRNSREGGSATPPLLSRNAPRVRPRVPPAWSHSRCRRRDTRSDDRASSRDGSAGRRSASRGLPSQRVCTSRTSSRCESEDASINDSSAQGCRQHDRQTHRCCACSFLTRARKRLIRLRGPAPPSASSSSRSLLLYAATSR